MGQQALRASGYLSIFLMPALLALGVWLQRPALAFGVCILVLPLARVVFGAIPARRPPVWAEGVATALHALPVLYVGALLLAIGVVLHEIASGPFDDAGDWLALGLSLWTTQLFATCVAHELLHRRAPREVALGRALAGVAGYPFLVDEHLMHHARVAAPGRAECPGIDESAWAFAARRAAQVLREAARSPHPQRLAIGVGASALTAIAFFAAGGWPALLVYVAASLGVLLGVQLITYIQHWGLAQFVNPGNPGEPRAWEDDCRFQAWITLHTSFHDAHHREARRPYYQLALAPGSPRLPAGYLILLFACMVPPVWRRLMRPALEHWQHQPMAPLSAGRRLTCFGITPARARTPAAD